CPLCPQDRYVALISLGFSGLGEHISKQLGLIRLALDVHNVELHLDKLSDLALHSHCLRCLAPAAIEQRICSHNTRCRGRLWLSHNADKRIYRCLGVTARQRSISVGATAIYLPSVH